MVSPCTKILKILPMLEYCEKHGIKTDYVGYVKNEIKRRSERQVKSIGKNNKKSTSYSVDKQYPIGDDRDWET